MSQSQSFVAAPVGPSVGEGFKQVAVSMLVEKGDQYLDEQGVFRTFSLNDIGLAVTAEMLVRRVERASRFGF